MWSAWPNWRIWSWPPEETQSMLRDLNAILDYVAELNELDTSGVAPLAQASELLSEPGDTASLPRADQVQPSLDRAHSDAAGAGDGQGVLQSAEGD